MRKMLCCLFCICFTMYGYTQTDSVPKKKEKKISLTGLPMVSFDPSKGTGFGAMGMAFFKLYPDAKPSSVYLMGKYTTLGNWGVGVMAQLFFSQDKYRISLGGGYMNNDFQTYEDTAGGQVEIPYNNHGGFFFASPSILLWNKFYVGTGVQTFRSHLDIDYPDPQPDSISTTWMNSLALTAMYDSKDSPYNATKGMNGILRANFFPEWFDNEGTYYKIHAEYNYYTHVIDSSFVLAARACANIGLGGIPFQAQTYIGGRDIRGYTKGEYRGDQTYDAQAELRWNFYRRWGCVGFFGVAMAVSPGNVSPLLPGGGVGMRFMVLPKYKINIGVDGALGKDDWGVYFRITEVF